MQGSKHERDRRWATQIQREDVAAFEALFRAYFDELCTFAWRYVQAPDVAEDLVQNVFVSIWQCRETWKPESTVKTYLYGAVRNEALKHIEHRDVVRRWEEEEQQDPPPLPRAPDEELNYKELKVSIQQVIDQLPERRRLVFVLHRQHGMTYREIAAVLDISVSTVETQISRALDALRRLLETPLLFLSVAWAACFFV